jgi:UDP:flavonoid glycosyltransferase YjiC (YdhE family)
VLPPEIDSALLRTVRRLAPRRDEMFRARGMEARFSCCDTISPYLTIAFATEAFTGPPPPGVQLVGPSFPIRARGDEVPPMPIPDGKRLVYASFGSQIFHLPEVFAKVHQACRRLGARLAISAGDLDIGGDWKDCHVYRYAPQLWLLEHAHAFITHGGANSVMEALTAGVPMLVSPMCNDQFHQAWFARRAGVGVVEDLVAAPVDRIAGHLGALFDDARIKERMREVSATYQRNGAREAARLIAALA